MRPRLVFVTQLIDPDDPVLGFVVAQVRELARHADVVVIANEVAGDDHGLDVEVVSLGKEYGHGRIRRALEFPLAVYQTVSRRRPAAVLAHMCPIYLTAAIPVTKPLGIPTLLWFVHPENSHSLRVAERCADAVLTALPDSYPRRCAKVRVIGHAIDTAAIGLAPATRSDGTTLRLLALGRTSGVKRYDLLIDAMAQARRCGVDARLRIVGPSVNDAERRHRVELVARAEQHVPGAIDICPGVTRAEVAKELARADALVNATDAGSADKVVFEAMASGRPVLAASPAFASLLDGERILMRFSGGDAGDLADRIVALARAPVAVRSEVGRHLRAKVEAGHSLHHWADQVVKTVVELVSHRPRRPR